MLTSRQVGTNAENDTTQTPPTPLESPRAVRLPGRASLRLLLVPAHRAGTSLRASARSARLQCLPGETFLLVASLLRGLRLAGSRSYLTGASSGPVERPAPFIPTLSVDQPSGSLRLDWPAAPYGWIGQRFLAAGRASGSLRPDGPGASRCPPRPPHASPAAGDHLRGRPPSHEYAQHLRVARARALRTAPKVRALRNRVEETAVDPGSPLPCASGYRSRESRLEPLGRRAYME